MFTKIRAVSRGTHKGMDALRPPSPTDEQMLGGIQPLSQGSITSDENLFIDHLSGLTEIRNNFCIELY